MTKHREDSTHYALAKSGAGYAWREEPESPAERASELFNLIVHGDALQLLARYPDSCVDLVFTSPPYADSRRKTYGGIHPDKYVEWLLPFADQLNRVLKSTGSFVLNIKEKTVNGQRHTYVIELILALKKRGWLWTEEYILKHL